MSNGTRLIAVAAAVLAAAAAFAADDNTLPATADEALKRATPAIEAARGAKTGESGDVAKNIRRAVDLMQPFARKSIGVEKFTAVWNEALTLTRYHGNKPSADYSLKVGTVADGIAAGLPIGRGWSADPPTPRTGHLQQYGGIQRTRKDGTVAASISICIYSFNTTYTGSGRQGGVGGENATGLAKEFLDYDKSVLAKVESSSTSIAARPLSREFSRAQYYEIVGKSKESGRVRLRSYFVKTSTRTYAFDVAQYLDANAADSPAEAWQNGGEDPELEALLGSIGEAQEKKR